MIDCTTPYAEKVSPLAVSVRMPRLPPFFMVMPVFWPSAVMATTPPTGTVISQYIAVGAAYEGPEVFVSSWNMRKVRTALSTLQTLMRVTSVRRVARNNVVAVFTVGRDCANN